MKIVHIARSYKGGAGKAAFRIHESLLEQGVDSNFISIDEESAYTKSGRESIVLKLPPQPKKDRILGWLIAKYKNWFVNRTRDKILQKYWDIYDQLTCEGASHPFSEYRLDQHVLVRDADIVHLHFVPNIVDYPTFFNNRRNKVVWTVHDMNPIEGIFHYESDRLKNQVIAGEVDILVFEYKKYMHSRIPALVLVAPSNWLADLAKKNQLMEGRDVFHIPYSISLDVFTPGNRPFLREKMLIGEEEFVVLLISDNVNNYRKGFDLALEALNYIKDLRIKVIIIGNGVLEEIGAIDIEAIGHVDNEYLLSEYYAVSDLFILPSREDNLPNVMLESLACGTPIVSFEVGGIKEHVIPGMTGIVAEDITSLSLANAIRKFKQESGLYKRNEIRRYAEKTFSPKGCATEYVRIYNTLVEPIRGNFWFDSYFN